MGGAVAQAERRRQNIGGVLTTRIVNNVGLRFSPKTGQATRRQRGIQKRTLPTMNRARLVVLRYACAVFFLAIGNWISMAGTLTGTSAIVPSGSVVNLSGMGPVDWIHWGTFSEYAPDRKYGVTPQIGDFAPLGTLTGPYQYDDN